MSLRHHTSGDAHPWRFDRRPQHLREGRPHGPILPMEEPPSLLARLFGVRR